MLQVMSQSGSVKSLPPNRAQNNEEGSLHNNFEQETQERSFNQVIHSHNLRNQSTRLEVEEEEKHEEPSNIAQSQPLPRRPSFQNEKVTGIQEEEEEEEEGSSLLEAVNQRQSSASGVFEIQNHKLQKLQKDLQMKKEKEAKEKARKQQQQEELEMQRHQKEIDEMTWEETE